MSSPPPKHYGNEDIYIPKRKQLPPVKIFPPLMPLIDVMFTLLMFFLVAAKVRQPEGLIPANMPAIGGQPPAGALDALRLQIKAHGKDKVGVVVYESGNENPVAVFEPIEGEPDKSSGNVAGRTQEAKQLYAFLQRKAEAYGTEKVPVVIQPVDDPRWEHVVSAFNQAVRVGFKKIGFAAQQ